jgi:hypothetical protein
MRHTLNGRGPLKFLYYVAQATNESTSESTKGRGEDHYYLYAGLCIGNW